MAGSTNSVYERIQALRAARRKGGYSVTTTSTGPTKVSQGLGITTGNERVDNAVAGYNSRAKLLGLLGDEEAQKEAAGDPGFLSTAFDYLQRPKSVVVGALGGLLGEYGNDNENTDISQRVGAALTGKERYGFGEFGALRWNATDTIAARAAKAGLALAGDVAADPLSYIGGAGFVGRQGERLANADIRNALDDQLVDRIAGGQAERSYARVPSVAPAPKPVPAPVLDVPDAGVPGVVGESSAAARAGTEDLVSEASRARENLVGSPKVEPLDVQAPVMEPAPLFPEPIGPRPGVPQAAAPTPEAPTGYFQDRREVLNNMNMSDRIVPTRAPDEVEDVVINLDDNAESLSQLPSTTPAMRQRWERGYTAYHRAIEKDLPEDKPFEAMNAATESMIRADLRARIKAGQTIRLTLDDGTEKVLTKASDVTPDLIRGLGQQVELKYKVVKAGIDNQLTDRQFFELANKARFHNDATLRYTNSAAEKAKARAEMRQAAQAAKDRGYTSASFADQFDVALDIDSLAFSPNAISRVPMEPTPAMLGWVENAKPTTPAPAPILEAAEAAPVAPLPGRLEGPAPAPVELGPELGPQLPGPDDLGLGTQVADDVVAAPVDPRTKLVEPVMDEAAVRQDIRDRISIAGEEGFFNARGRGVRQNINRELVDSGLGQSEADDITELILNRLDSGVRGGLRVGAPIGGEAGELFTTRGAGRLVDAAKLGPLADALYDGLRQVRGSKAYRVFADRIGGRNAEIAGQYLSNKITYPEYVALRDSAAARMERIISNGQLASATMQSMDNLLRSEGHDQARLREVASLAWGKRTKADYSGYTDEEIEIGKRVAKLAEEMVAMTGDQWRGLGELTGLINLTKEDKAFIEANKHLFQPRVLEPESQVKLDSARVNAPGVQGSRGYSASTQRGGVYTQEGEFANDGTFSFNEDGALTDETKFADLTEGQLERIQKADVRVGKRITERDAAEAEYVKVRDAHEKLAAARERSTGAAKARKETVDKHRAERKAANDAARKARAEAKAKTEELKAKAAEAAAKKSTPGKVVKPKKVAAVKPAATPKGPDAAVVKKAQEEALAANAARKLADEAAARSAATLREAEKKFKAAEAAFTEADDFAKKLRTRRIPKTNREANEQIVNDNADTPDRVFRFTEDPMAAAEQNFNSLNYKIGRMAQVKTLMDAGMIQRDMYANSAFKTFEDGQRWVNIGGDIVKGRNLSSEAKNLFVPEHLAGPISKLLTTEPRQFNAFMTKAFFPFMNFWRSTATVGRGFGYHIRNVVGATWNNYLGGVTTADYGIAKTLMATERSVRTNLRNHILDPGKTLDPDLVPLVQARLADKGSLDYQDLEDLVTQGVRGRLQGQAGPGKAGDLFQLRQAWRAQRVGDDNILAQDLGNDTLREGDYLTREKRPTLFQGVNPDEKTRGMQLADKLVDNPWIRVNANIAQFSEAVVRTAAFVQGARRVGLADNGIGADIFSKGLQYDYANLSDFERRVLKNIFPFATFARNNLPHQLVNLFTQPGKFNALFYTQDELKNQFGLRDENGDIAEGVNNALPNWNAEKLGFATQFGDNAQPLVLMLESPATDLNKVLNGNSANPLDLNELMNSSNPLAKTLIETAAKKDLGTGASLDRNVDSPWWVPSGIGDVGPEGQRQVPKLLTNAVADLLPPAGVVDRLSSGDLDSALKGNDSDMATRKWSNRLSLIAGAPVSTFDFNQQAGELQRRIDVFDKRIDDSTYGDNISDAELAIIRQMIADKADDSTILKQIELMRRTPIDEELAQ